MDDILITLPDQACLQSVLHNLTEALQNKGLQIAPNKPLVTYLGQVLDSKMVTHVPLQLKKKFISRL